MTFLQQDAQQLCVSAFDQLRATEQVKMLKVLMKRHHIKQRVGADAGADPVAEYLATTPRRELPKEPAQ